MRSRKLTIFLMTFIIILSGCNSQPSEKTEKIKLTVDFSMPDGKFQVYGKTNIPDGAFVNIALFKDAGSDIKSLKAQDRAVVSGGNYSSTLGLPQESGDYILEATFTPWQQGDSIAAIYGPKGEKIKDIGIEAGKISVPDKITGAISVSYSTTFNIGPSDGHIQPVPTAPPGGSNGASDAPYLYNGSGNVAVAISESAMDEALDAAISNNNQRFNELVLSGKLLPVKNGTKVDILNAGMTRTKVRISEGAFSGRTGYVQTEFVKVK